MKLVWDEMTWEDYLWWQTRDRKILERINTLIKDIGRNENRQARRSGLSDGVRCVRAGGETPEYVASVGPQQRAALVG